MVTVPKTLDEILREENLTEKHLSPSLKYHSRSETIQYVPSGKPTRPASEPEKAISKYLSERNIVYEEQRPLLLKEEDGAIHQRFPDFYIPHLDLYIEMNGMETDPESDARYEHKNRQYDMNNVRYDVIHKKEWDSDIWKERLDNILTSRGHQDSVSSNASQKEKLEYKVQDEPKYGLITPTNQRAWYTAAAAAAMIAIVNYLPYIALL